MAAVSRFKVTAADREGPTWTRLERHLNARLEQLRADNDNPSLGEVATARVRGRIEEIKALLDAAKEDPPPIQT